jgi:hypothetical protein
MFRKEIREAALRLAECLIILIAVPMALIWDRLAVKFNWDFMEIWNGIFLFVVFLYAFYAGSTFFHAEKKDRAWEYLLSLPTTKGRIVAFKFAPRFLFLAALYVFQRILAHKSVFSSEMLYLLFLFIVPVFLSLAIDSIVIGFLGIVLLFMMFYFTTPTISYLALKLGIISSLREGQLPLQLVSAVLISAPFGIAFYRIIKNLDAKPLKLQLKPYFTIALPVFACLVVLIVLFYGNFLAFLKTQ